MAVVYKSSKGVGVQALDTQEWLHGHGTNLLK